MVISRNQPDGMVKRWPDSDALDERVLKNIEDELVPINERGEFKMGTLMGLFTCLPDNDCTGGVEDWEKVAMYTNTGKTGPRYETIRWKYA